MTDQTPREDENTNGEDQQTAQENSEQTTPTRTGAEDGQRYTTSGVLHRITRWLRGK